MSSAGSRAFQNARLQKKFKKQADAITSAAAAAYGQGRVAETEALCRQILKELPDHFDATHLLGLCAHDARRREEAQQLLERAITLDPRSADALSNLAILYFDLRKYEDARRCQEKAVALKPNFPVALTNLGNTLLHMGRGGLAVEMHDRAIKLRPDYADAFCNRGMAEMMLGLFQRAHQSFERALVFQPRHVEAIMGRGMVNMEMRHYETAEAAFALALSLKPGSPKILAQRGRLNLELSRLQQAAADFDAALAVLPTLELALRGKAQVQIVLGNTAVAFAACKALLEENPESEIGMALMASCFASQGDIATAVQHLDSALAIRPDYGDAITRKIFLLDHLPEADFASQQAVRKTWWEHVGSKYRQRTLTPRSLDPERRIVVGYVSQELRRHSAGSALMPVLSHHDHGNFEIVCYSCSPVQDEATAAFKTCADRWVDAWQMSDEELADRIQADNIDVLIDVSGHTSGNRLNVFARKPAPIQVTGYGHASGTGLATMDYLLGDAVFIPESARHHFAETVYSLPCLITIEPILDVPASPLPMLQNGYVTFGVYNRISKISDECIRVWARVMRAVEGSKIIVKHGMLDDLMLRDNLVARFVENGIPQESITCLGLTSRADHLLALARIDISLDTFPQNGGISTWESLYAGVPVVAELGNGASARAGGAILGAVGLHEWVADDDDGYVEIARKFAGQSAVLEKLRAELPARIANSAAGNPEIFTRKVEEGYRRFWRDYCASAATDGGT